MDTGDLRVGVNDRWSPVQVPGDRVQGLSFAYTESTGDLWLASRSGLHLFRRFDLRWTRTRRPFPDLANRINVIVPEEDGGFALGSAGGVALHAADGTVVRWTTADGQDLKHVTGLVRDERGRYLISSGSDFSGVFRRAVDGPWERLDAGQGLGARVHRLFKAPDGTIYAAALSGLGTGGLYRIADDHAELLSEGVEVLGGGAYAVDFGPDGTIWVGGSWGLARLGPDGTWTEWPLSVLGASTLLLLLALATGIAVRRKRQADRTIRESERRLRAYLDQAPESILLFDMHRRVLVDSNDAALPLLDRTRTGTEYGLWLCTAVRWIRPD